LTRIDSIYEQRDRWRELERLVFELEIGAYSKEERLDFSRLLKEFPVLVALGPNRFGPTA
jgi:hypothetical protein